MQWAAPPRLRTGLTRGARGRGPASRSSSRSPRVEDTLKPVGRERGEAISAARALPRDWYLAPWVGHGALQGKRRVLPGPGYLCTWAPSGTVRCALEKGRGGAGPGTSGAQTQRLATTRS